MSDIILFARQFLKIPYVLGSLDPKVGLDCATFVLHFFEQLDGTPLNIMYEDSVFDEYSKNSKIYEKYIYKYLSLKKYPCAFDELDILVFNERERHSQHVGIYLGQNQFIHCNEYGVNIYKLSLCTKNIIYVGKFKDGIRNGQSRWNI
jgi:cell wall-associated NlpC family hydrolase